MLVDRAPRLAVIMRSLLDASQKGDWRQLLIADKELSLLTAELSRRVNLSEAELTALQQVRLAHAQAMQRCADEMQRLNTAMDALCQHKEGLIAYGLADEKDEPTRP